MINLKMMTKPNTFSSLFNYFLLTTVSVLFSAQQANASSYALDNFYTDTKSFSADFEQVVVDKFGDSLKRSTGKLIIARPDKFYMIYTYPDEQQYISNGEVLWVYDKDLEQVTIKKFDQSVKKSPVLLLSGSKEIRYMYDIKESVIYDKPEQDVFILKPKKDDEDVGTQFSRIELVFSNNVLFQLKMSDHFDHMTVLTLSNQKVDQSIDEELFTFKIPSDIDVLDNTKK